MREAKILVPLYDNRGRNRTDVSDKVEATLITHFGGCTRRSVYGSWKGPDGEVQSEEIIELIVALGCDQFMAEQAMNTLADYVGKEMQQLSVYVLYPDGTVALRDTSQLWTRTPQKGET